MTIIVIHFLVYYISKLDSRGIQSRIKRAPTICPHSKVMIVKQKGKARKFGPQYLHKVLQADELSRADQY